MLSDKSVLTAIVAVLVGIGAHFGLQLDDTTVASFVGVFALAIVKHALEAHGATAAATTAAANDNVPAAPTAPAAAPKAAA
jgi:hypothetical protein